MLRITLLFALLLISSMALAKIYKWVDANGEVHYQDHPRGSPEVFSTANTPVKKTNHKPAVNKPANTKLLKDMEKARKQREQARKKRQEAERKQAQKCVNYQYQTDKLAARIKKKYSQFSNDRPPSYALDQKKLQQRKQYLDKYCN